MKLIVKRFQRLCHVIWGINILFEKLTPEIRGALPQLLYSRDLVSRREILKSSYGMISDKVDESWSNL